MRSFVSFVLLVLIGVAVVFAEPIAFLIGLPIVAAHYEPAFTAAVAGGFVVGAWIVASFFSEGGD